jgi:hypothetical protein
VPLTAFLTLDGRRIPLDEIDIRNTIVDFGLPPADVAAVIAQQRERQHIPQDQITASQIGSGARQIYLERTIDFAREPKREKAALLGTMKHAMLNIEHDGLLVEQRVVAKSGRFSAQYDTYVPETGVVRDRKGVGYFKVLMALKNGVLKEAHDYVMQLNLTGWLLRQNGNVVKELWLDFEPTGVGKLEKKELEEKFGITDPTLIPMQVPFIPQAEVLSAYEELHRAVVEAHKTGETPTMCSAAQTWNGKKCTAGWCRVAAECAVIAAKRGEEHPLNKKAVA